MITINMDSQFIGDIELKKKRAPNFSEKEKLFLLHVIGKHKSIVENKSTKGIFLKTKEDAWEAIAKEFNSAGFGPSRDVNQLKIYYKNLKSVARREISEKRIQLNKTGNGSSLSSLPETTQQLVVMLGEQFEPHPSWYNDNAGILDIDLCEKHAASKNGVQDTTKAVYQPDIALLAEVSMSLPSATSSPSEAVYQQATTVAENNMSISPSQVATQQTGAVADQHTISISPETSQVSQSTTPVGRSWRSRHRARHTRTPRDLTIESLRAANEKKVEFLAREIERLEKEEERKEREEQRRVREEEREEREEQRRIREEERREREEQRREAEFKENMLLVQSQIRFYNAAALVLNDIFEFDL